MADTQDIMRGYEWQTGNQLENLKGMQSSFSGVNDAASTRAKYGIKDTSTMFDPLFKSLATNRARRMQGASMRAGRSASPEMSFSNVEQDYEGGLQDLLGKKNMADNEQQQYVANLLRGAQSGQDSFGLNKSNSLVQGYGQAHGQVLGRERFNMENKPTSALDVGMAVLGAGTKVAGAAAGAPVSKVFNFASRFGSGGGGGGNGNGSGVGNPWEAMTG